MTLYGNSTSTTSIRYSTSSTNEWYYSDTILAPSNTFESTYVSLFHLSSTRKPGYEDIIFKYEYSSMMVVSKEIDIRIRSLEEVSRDLKINIREKDLFDMGIDPEILFIIGDTIKSTKYKIVLRDKTFFYSYCIKPANHKSYFYFTQIMVEEL